MAQATFGTLKGLSARKENELCVSIARELTELLEEGASAPTHDEILAKLQDCVRMYGSSHLDDFFVRKVVFEFTL
jgi:hypothetical protein